MIATQRASWKVQAAWDWWRKLVFIALKFTVKSPEWRRIRSLAYVCGPFSRALDMLSSKQDAYKMLGDQIKSRNFANRIRFTCSSRDQNSAIHVSIKRKIYPNLATRRARIDDNRSSPDKSRWIFTFRRFGPYLSELATFMTAGPNLYGGLLSFKTAAKRNRSLQ